MSPDYEKYPQLLQALSKVNKKFPDRLLAGFERILQRIESLWGTREAVFYLNSLLLEDRPGRQGFTGGVLGEISMLKQLHEFLFPELSFSRFDPVCNTEMSAPVNLAAFKSAPVDQTVEFTAAETKEEKPAATAASEVTASAPQEPQKDATLPAVKHISWPDIRTQHDLSDAAELRRANGRIYATQGKPIGEILNSFEVIDKHALAAISKDTRIMKSSKHKPTGQLLVEMGIIDAEALTRALCIQSGVLMVDALAIDIPSDVLRLIPGDVARKKLVIPLGTYNKSLYLAVSDPFTFAEQHYFSFMTGLSIEPVFAPRNEIINRLNMYGLGKSRPEAREEFRTLANKAMDEMPAIQVRKQVSEINEINENDSTIINLVNKLIANAIEEGASDIHIELFQHSTTSRIRFRRDGNLEKFADFPMEYHNAVVSRIKIMSELDIAEKRRPQDGKISYPMPNGQTVELRVSTIPTTHGTEFVTIRILPSGEPVPLEKLGMSERDMLVFRKIFQRSYGLILVCGPTGSGKTTTLHSVLNELNTEDVKIWTAEDPVEIVQNNLCQVQINDKIDLTFAHVLRSFLRADPDIIMIGEMRDTETAKIALEASMTGHLVLSTLHTNSASETVSRLIDLEVDAFNLSDALLAILAQRLARKLCQACASKEEASQRELEDLAAEYYHSAHGKMPGMSERDAIIQKWRDSYAEDGKIFFRHPVGCKVCGSGYKGLIGLFELLQATPAMKRLVRSHAAASEYLGIGITEGMLTLKQDGIEKVLGGITDMVQIHGACS
jgi:type II secretory ATPase GspE/PulE/Tfp pilus assembly ATPase PilB-like protein